MGREGDDRGKVHHRLDGHLVYLHALAIVSSASMKIGVHESFQIMVLSRYMPRSGIAGSYGSTEAEVPVFFGDLM